MLEAVGRLYYNRRGIVFMGKRSVFLKKGDRFGKLVVLQELESKNI